MNFLEKSFDFLASTVGQYVVDTWRQRSHIDSHLHNLRGALPKAHGLIRRSECWRLPAYKTIDVLLPLLKDAVYEAESIVDELEYQRLKHKVEKSLPGEFVARYFHSWMSGFPGKVKMVQENLYNLCNKMEEECNRLEVPENHNQFSKTARPITTKYGETSNFYGRDKELNDVICLLGVSRSISESSGRKRIRKHNMRTLAVRENSSNMENKGNVRIISVVGLGGVGKTTLAQKVYSDTSVKCYFEELIWVCISENFDAERLIREIIEYVTKSTCDDSTLSALQETLKETLKSKRFLLVLDDAWRDEEKDWQQLLEPIREGIEGSAIIVTTRSQKVAEIAGKCMNCMDPICLEGLEESIYWEFFKKCAFCSEVRPESYPELEKIGKQICKKLKGSPLAAKTIGGLLKIRLNVRHWSNIKDRNHCSDYLKHFLCVAFCSVFELLKH